MFKNLEKDLLFHYCYALYLSFIVSIFTSFHRKILSMKNRVDTERL